jgi:uncharacterized membrane protein
MMGSLPMTDALVVIRLMAVLALVTWAARPLALRLVPGGSGWVAALLLGWTVTGWVPWLLAALHLVPFGQASFSGVAALLLARLWLRPAPPAQTKAVLALGAGFVVLFWLGLAMRLEKADLSGLEKFTDMAFLTAAMRTTFMPPLDPWYGGEVINYYYVGQAMAGAWGNLLGARPDQTYQIAMATLFALTGLSIWAVTTRLAMAAGRGVARTGGAVAALLVLYGGNFHSALYNLARPLVPATNPAFYFPDSTRFIGFDPATQDKGFTEFPAYAFAVGDLHAHVAALPVFALGLMILLAIVTRGGQWPDTLQAAGFGWVMGLCAMINSWDVAILGLMALLAGTVVALRDTQSWRNRLDRLGQQGVIVATAAFLTAAPFLGQFTPFASGIVAAPATTPMWQWLVLYGHGIAALLLFVMVVSKHPTLRRHVPVGFLFVVAMLILIVPELVIVRDIYGLDYARANTMFKLSFRAQPLLIIAAVATLALAWRVRFRVGVGLVAVPLLSILAYAPHIFVWPSTIRNLHGLGFLGDERALVEAARTLPLHADEVIIEASGPAFLETARVSAMTGQPAVIGWAAHEWLWRNDPERPNTRARDVQVFYTTDDAAQRCSIVKRYSIRYAVLGQIEARFYETLNTNGVAGMGPAVHASSGGQIIQIDLSRCP